MMDVPPLPVDLSGIHLAGPGLSNQLYQALRERFLDGRLPGGTRLPASRELALLLGVSRNTVLRALDRLQGEGHLEARVGDGTYVAGSWIGVGSTVPVGATDAEALQRIARYHLPPPPEGAPRAFRVGVPAFDLFPFETWARLQARFWRRPPLACLGYGDAAGDGRLRELVAAYLRTGRGLHCDPRQVIITSGAQQGIALCAQLLAEPGDRVAFENPGYQAAAHAFAVAGLRLRGIDVDDQGLDSEALHEGPACRLAYVTPSHQYPSGVTLSLARRLALLRWAERNGSWIVEDDYDGEYRYGGTPLAPLAALDRHARVIYVGTFCKIAFPALRLGYLVAPPDLAQAFARRRALDMRHSDIGTQAVMAEFIAAGHFQRHIRRMRAASRRRRDALLAGWPRGIAGCGPLPSVEAGLHLCVRVADQAREQALIQAAARVGVEINALSDYWLADSEPPVARRAGLVLGFAGVSEPRIAEALLALRAAWR